MYEDQTYIGEYIPPLRTADPQKKTYNYFLRNCQNIYGTYINNGAALPYASFSEFKSLRQFANGDQPEDFYKKYFSRQEIQDDPVIDSTLGYIGRRGKPKGFMKPLWEVMSPAPKIITSIIGKLTKTQTDVSCDAIDNVSKSLERDAKIELWGTAENLDYFRQAHAAAGIKMDEPDFIPEDIDELQLYEDLGGFKPAFTRCMEKLIKHTTDISAFEEIESAMYKDYLTYNVMGCVERYDPETGKYRVEHVDPENAGCQWSRYQDCRDIEWAYEFLDVNITKLRQYFPDEPDDSFTQLAEKFCGYAGNPHSSKFPQYTGQTEEGFRKYDFFKVPVVHAVWIDDDGKRQVIQKTKYRETMYETDISEVVKDTEGRTSRVKLKRYCFEAYWIVGTNKIYQWGKCHDNAGDVRLPFHFYVGNGKSIIKQLIPLFHNFQVLWIKYLNCLALAINSGYFINVDMLMNIGAGGDEGKGDKGESDREIAFRRLLDTGIGFFSQVSPTGTQMNTTPVFEFKGGMGQMFQDVIAGFQFNMSMVESITGVNPITLGSTPNPNAPVGTTEMAVASVSNILKPILDSFLSVKKQMARNVCRLIHNSCWAYEFSRKAYERVIGEFDMQVLMAADRDSTEYAINLTIRPNDAEKQAMIQQIQQAMALDRDGNSSGLTGLEGIILIRRIEAGIPMAQIELEFENRRRRNIQQAAEAKSKNMQEQADLNDRNTQVAAKVQEEQKKADHDRAMELQKLKNAGVVQNTALQEGIRAEMAQEKPDTSAS